MAGTAPSGITPSTNITVKAREVDFVTQFNEQWKAWFNIMGIMNPIKKDPGTVLKAYKASVKGEVPEQVGEGVDVPLTETQVVPVEFQDLVLKKHRKAVTAEAVAKYGATIAVQKTDKAFRNKLFKGVLNEFYTFLGTGKLVGNMKTWQKALAMARTAVIDRFEGSDLTVTEVVGFANIMDYGKYIGEKDITIQTMEGINYVQNFLGYKTLFLLPTEYLAQGKVIATPVDNVDMYYIDPSAADFKELGLDFTVDPELGLIGFHANGNYTNFSGESQAMLGMKLWAEYLDGICVIEVKDVKEVDPKVAETDAEAGE